MNQLELKNWITKISIEFYELVYTDTWFKKMFINVTQEHITNQQIDFMVQSFGGPKKFSGRAPKEAHPHIWIDEDIWNYRDYLLKKAFQKVLPPGEIQEKWLRIEEAFKGSLINSGGPETCTRRFTTDDIIYYPIPDHLKKLIS